MKAQRLLSMLLLLQASGRRCARELARELEVSERTVYRDVDALAQAGVPVYAERGSNGGIVLSDGYRRALTQLGEDDLRSLLVMTSDPLADLGYTDRRSRVLERLLGALPPSVREAALHTRGRILVDQRRWYLSAQPANILAVLRDGALNDRQVEIVYRDRSGKLSERRLDPLGLVAKAGVWYVIARTDGEMRSFRADRILDVRATADGFARPADFDLDEYWRGTTQKLESQTAHYWLTLRVAPHLLPDIAFMEHEVVDREAAIVKVNFGSAGDAAWRLFAWRDDAEVLEPVEFIGDLVARSRALIERYAGRLASLPEPVDNRT